MAAVWPRKRAPQLERQLDGALVERVALSPPKLSPAVTEIHPEAEAVFKDSYLIDFLHLSEPYSAADLEHALIERLKDFLIELGRENTAERRVM